MPCAASSPISATRKTWKASAAGRAVAVAEHFAQFRVGELAHVARGGIQDQVQLGDQLRRRQRVHQLGLEVQELDDVVERLAQRVLAASATTGTLRAPSFASSAMPAGCCAR
jgi:hypothetical protein